YGRSDDHVKAVKARKDVEERTINAGVEPQVEVDIGVHVLVALAEYEDKAEDDGGSQPENSLAAVVGADCMVRDGERQARSEQQSGVDGRQPEGADGLELFNDAAGGEVRPRPSKPWPEQVFVLQIRQHGCRDFAGVPKRSEE